VPETGGVQDAAYDGGDLREDAIILGIPPKHPLTLGGHAPAKSAFSPQILDLGPGSDSGRDLGTGLR
jgi:hypothetical protein